MSRDTERKVRTPSEIERSSSKNRKEKTDTKKLRTVEQQVVSLYSRKCCVMLKNAHRGGKSGLVGCRKWLLYQELAEWNCRGNDERLTCIDLQ